jgi:hypothetical protein
MPLMEMVFRLFLANGNDPMTLEEVQTRLQDKLRESGDLRDVSLPKLKRIIESDHYYGLRPAPSEEPEKAA